MGIMSFLRNRAGVILVGAIGFAIVAFLIGDVVKFGGSFFKGNQTDVGVVAGETIKYEEFKQKVDQNEAQFKQQMGQNTLNPQMSAYVVENTWNQTVTEILLNKEVARLGLAIGESEIADMITGKNPDPQVVQAFANPQTGQVDRAQLSAFISNMKNQDPSSPMAQQWGNFLVSLKRGRLFQKYNTLVKNSIYVTSLEAREDYEQRNKLASFSYVNLDYASVPDNKVTITDADYKAYYDENKNRFKNPEDSRSIEYVVFNAAPSKADSAAVKAQVDKITGEFRQTTNDSLFVSINAETKMPVTYVKKGQLDHSLDSLVFGAAKGTVVGPILDNGVYKIAKVIDERVGPDSVKASHILLNPTTMGGLDKAQHVADSLITLINKGTPFAELAAKFGTDGSKDKGGDLGTFSRGAMIPAFEETVFNGKTGDLKRITTQYGVHVVRIDKQIGSSKVVKVAVVDKSIVSSNQTEQAAYAKASAFLSDAKDQKAFDEAIAKNKYRKLLADHISASQSMISGLENPRELVRWAFGADKGDISDKVFEMENTYVVARLADVRKKGILSLDQVKNDIEPFVRNKVKARMLTDKINAALSGASSIQQVASKLGRPVNPVQNLVFANPIIPGVAQENSVVGTVFGMQPKKISKAIEGEQGVYVVEVVGFSNPAPLTNTVNQKQQMLQMMSQRAQNQVIEVLRTKGNITDNRLRFF